MGTFGTFLYIVLLLLFGAALSAQSKVKRTYSKYSEVLSQRGITAEQAVQIVLQKNGVEGVVIQGIEGELTDNFNPKTNVISLSEPVLGHSSIAAIGVACHEAGHAVQYAKSYLPIKLRNAIVPACNIGSTLGIPIAILGLIMQTALNMTETGFLLIEIGIIMYSLVAIFQLITLPVELDASRRALKAIEDAEILTKDENQGAKKVLKAAAMTYVVALATAIVNLLRIIVIFGGRRK